MHLMNGNTHERTRSSDSVEVLKCGCAHDPIKWLQMCDEHYDEWADRHARAVNPTTEAFSP